MTDELEQRLRAADPVPAAVPVDTARSARARTHLERAMTEAPITLEPPQTPRVRRWALAVLAGVVAVVGVGVAVTAGTDSGGDQPAPLELTAAPGDVMQSCLALTPEGLREVAQAAFAGTVVDIDGGVVTLSVDRWYAGDEVSEVVVSAPPGGDVALLGSVTFEQGGHYLISARDGAVATCGMSDAVSPELEAIYDAAFAG